ncbi:hypothetical protein C4D60_Mb05t22460 [Musa balbisiana]|uniref:Uncharacterized protein n=1 Tax=Musa balbisiana TaxID=52838 RepID=A0A4S8JY23_MUSBA|nr:hypothetical protein C4D60_Mb05t22460 [Musa balbisiana]
MRDLRRVLHAVKYYHKRKLIVTFAVPNLESAPHNLSPLMLTLVLFNPSSVSYFSSPRVMRKLKDGFFGREK